MAYTDTNGVEYAALEYIGSTAGSGTHLGVQWIDTGFQHTSNTVVDIKVAITGSLPNNNSWFSYYGSRTSNNNADQFGGWVYRPGLIHYHGVAKTEGGSSLTATKDVAFIAHLEKNGPCTIDGQALATGSGGTANRNDYLFAMNNGGSAAFMSVAQIYWCVVRDGGEVVRDFVPVARVSDNKPGMFDRKHNAFYVNGGSGADFVSGPELDADDVAVSAVWTGAASATGVFDAGNWSCTNAAGEEISGAVPGVYAEKIALAADADWRSRGTVAFARNAVIDLRGNELKVSAMPAVAKVTDSAGEYELLEYLESSGRQFIDTLYFHTADTKAELKVAFPSLPSNGNWAGYFGGRSGPGVAGQFGAWIYTTGGSTYHWKGVDATEESVLTSTPVAAGTQYTIFLDNSDGGSCTIDGVEFATGNDVSSGHRVLLFAIADARTSNADRNALESMSHETFMYPVRVYSCKIWTGDTLERDLVPARRLSDGEPGMLDRTDGSFYANAGNDSGYFTTGASLGTTGAGTSGGTLRLETASGKTNVNTTVSLGGSLKFVKAGAGTFIASKEYQTYHGGTEVEAGTLKFGVSGQYLPVGNVKYGTDGNLLSNAAFDEDSISGTYQYRPDVAGWTFSGNAGLASATFVPNGNGTAIVKYNLFLQTTTEDAEASQEVEVESAGVYRYAFSCAGRNGYLGGRTLLVLTKGSETNVLTSVMTRESTYRFCDGFVRIDEPGTYTLRFYQAATGTEKVNVFDNVSFTPWSGDRAEIVIDDGATLDMNGQKNFFTHHIVMNGGTLVNSASDIGEGDGQLRVMRLAADSSYSNAKNYGFIGWGYSESTLSLCGQTLAATVPSGKYLRLYCTTVSGGTLDISGAGWLATRYAGIEARTAKLRLGCAATLVDCTVEVGDYEACYTGNNNYGTGVLNVYGTFKPEADRFYGPTMQDGSTMDLSAWPESAGWPMYSRFTSGVTNVSFAADAKVAVNLAGRSDLKALALGADPYLLKWDEEPSTVEFSLDETTSARYSLKRDATGLRLSYGKGMILIFR